jgi:hypothetical protein
MKKGGLLFLGRFCYEMDASTEGNDAFCAEKNAEKQKAYAEDQLKKACEELKGNN